MSENQLATTNGNGQKNAIKANGHGLQLRTIEDMYRFAQYVANSGLAPRGMNKPEAILVAVEYGEDHPDYLPFLRDGKPIEVGEFGADRDEKSGVFLHRAVARLDKGIPNPKERPCLPLPWSLEFKLTIIENSAFKESTVRNLCSDGGIAIGLGTYRGQFGKFVVDRWS